MEVSGSALLRTLKAVLDDASNALRRGEEDDDEAGLERVALGAVLGILELGAAKRADDEEAASPNLRKVPSLSYQPLGAICQGFDGWPPPIAQSRKSPA